MVGSASVNATVPSVSRTRSSGPRPWRMRRRRTSRRRSGARSRPRWRTSATSRPCALRTPNNGVVILADKMLPPASTADDPRSSVPHRQDRVREVLPVEGAARVREPPIALGPTRLWGPPTLQPMRGRCRSRGALGHLRCVADRYSLDCPGIGGCDACRGRSVPLRNCPISFIAPTPLDRPHRQLGSAGS